MKNIPLLLSILFLFTTASCLSQQLNQFTSHQSNWQLFNPAAINYIYFSHNKMRHSLDADFQKQWLGFEGGPLSYSLRYEKIPSLYRYGIHHYSPMKYGLYLSRDVTDAISTTSASGNYAYFLQFGEDDKKTLSFGLNAGVSQYRLDSDKINFEHPDDPLVSDQTQLFVDFTIGAFFFIPKKLYAGISIPQTYSTAIYNKSNTPEGNAIERSRHVYLIFGNFISIGRWTDQFILEPSVILRYIPGIEYGTIINNFPLSTDVSFRLKYEQIWGSLGFSTLKTGTVDFGTRIPSFLIGEEGVATIGIAYRFPVGWNSLYFGHSFEFTISYSWL